MPCFGKMYCYISKTIHSVRVFRRFLLWSRECKFVCNRDLSVLTSMPFDGTSNGGKRYMGLDEDAFLPAAFSKVQKIGKGLRSNGTSNVTGFLQRNRFTRLRKDWKDRARASVSLLTLYIRASRPLLVGFLSRYLDIPSGSLRSGILCEIDSDLFVFSFQDSFVNMITTRVQNQ